MSYLAVSMLGFVGLSGFLLWRERREQTLVRFLLLVSFIVGGTLFAAAETMRPHF